MPPIQRSLMFRIHTRCSVRFDKYFYFTQVTFFYLHSRIDCINKPAHFFKSLIECLLTYINRLILMLFWLVELIPQYSRYIDAAALRLGVISSVCVHNNPYSRTAIQSSSWHYVNFSSCENIETKKSSQFLVVEKFK
jgi:hypothetical protein